MQCSFSNGGHLFAAVHGNIIQIYSTTTFENIANLKGHNGKVRSVVWSADDNKIVSCGLDGAVYEWDTINGKRIGESVLKSCSYTSVAITPDGKTMFAVGSDKKLKEIADSQVGLSVSFSIFLCNDLFILCIILSSSAFFKMFSPLLFSLNFYMYMFVYKISSCKKLQYIVFLFPLLFIVCNL